MYCKVYFQVKCLYHICNDNYETERLIGLWKITPFGIEKVYRFFIAESKSSKIRSPCMSVTQFGVVSSWH